MTEPYRWRADPPDGSRGSEPDVPVRKPKPSVTPKPAPLVTPVPVPAVSPVILPSARPTRPPVVPPKQHTPEQKQDAAATLGAYDELGPDYQDAVIESFLNRMDQMNAARQRPPMMPVPMQPPYMPMPKKKSGNSQVAAMITCVALAIPLTAIAGGIVGFFGVLATWVGIIIVSFIWSRGMNRD